MINLQPSPQSAPLPYDTILRYGAYICFRLNLETRESAACAPIPELANELGLTNEFNATNGHPPEAIAFLRRTTISPMDSADDQLANSDAIVHVASATEKTVATFCSKLTPMLGRGAKPYVLRGVVRPTRYTGGAMHEFAYAHQVLQQAGSIAPNAFLVPMSKTAEWWAQDWMERHTYFLPRYETDGRICHEGHALAAAPGIACLMRRTYKAETEPAPAGTYDFINYFECADADAPTFHAVCNALRDTNRNPEWKFVREGPTWAGRRVRDWCGLFNESD
jgi:hypothetical protein